MRGALAEAEELDEKDGIVTTRSAIGQVDVEIGTEAILSLVIQLVSMIWRVSGE